MKRPLPALEATAPALVTLALYLTFAQDVFYKADGPQLLQLYRDGQTSWPYHPLYLPMLTLFLDVVGTLGLDAYHGAVAFSALGTSIGVYFCTLAGYSFGIGRNRALLTAALVGVTPGVFFFATVVELPGPLFGAAGLAFWCSARLYERSHLRNALFLALATSFAAGIHSSGHLLIGLFLACSLAAGAARDDRTWPRPRELGNATFALCIHVVLLFALPALYSAFGYEAAPGRSLAFLREGFGGSQSPSLLPQLLWREWLQPFLPLSLLVFLGLSRSALRLQTLAFLLALIPYWLLTLALLGEEPERGAYYVPCALPAAMLVVRLFPVRTCLIWIVLSAGLGILTVQRHERAHPDSGFAAAVADELGETPGLVLLADGNEWTSMLVHGGDREYWQLLKLFEPLLHRDPAQVLTPEERIRVLEFAEAIRVEFERRLRAGERLLLSSGAKRLFESRPRLRVLFETSWNESFVRKRADSRGVELWEIVLRP